MHAQEHLRSIHRKVPPLPKVTTLYRGLAVDGEALDVMVDDFLIAISTGEPFSFASNGSGSLDPERSLRYATKPGKQKLLFEIKAKTGIYLQKITTQAADFEILQGDFARYNVVRVHKLVPYGPHGELVTVVQLQEQ